jgi:hypothetical protein
MSKITILEIPADQQAWMLRELRALALWLPAGLTDSPALRPRQDAERRFQTYCSARAESVYRTVEAWQDGTLAAQWWPEPEPAPSAPAPSAASRFSRLLAWLITQPPRLRLVPDAVELRGAGADGSLNSTFSCSPTCNVRP